MKGESYLEVERITNKGMHFERFIVFGLSHKELDLEERERYIKNSPEDILEELLKGGKILGYVNLSTCLRVEYYIEIAKNVTIEDVVEGLRYKKSKIKIGYEAIDHLFKVSCGFESVIKGEDQILAQVKKAFNEALKLERTTTRINVIFNKAIELGKKFRNKSKVSHNALSLEAISLKFIKNTIGDLKDKKILILGVGDLAKDIMKLLMKERYKSLTITNRSYHKALEVKDTYNAEVINFENKLDETVKSDIIISATSAPHTIIKYADIEPLLEKNKKYIFLDLAVPRDIDDKISELSNVQLYNIDDVWGIYYKNLETREVLVHEYEYLIEEQKLNLEKWIEKRCEYIRD